MRSPFKTAWPLLNTAVYTLLPLLPQGSSFKGTKPRGRAAADCTALLLGPRSLRVCPGRRWVFSLGSACGANSNPWHTQVLGCTRIAQGHLMAEAMEAQGEVTPLLSDEHGAQDSLSGSEISCDSVTRVLALHIYVS